MVPGVVECKEQISNYKFHTNIFTLFSVIKVSLTKSSCCLTNSLIIRPSPPKKYRSVHVQFICIWYFLQRRFIVVEEQFKNLHRGDYRIPMRKRKRKSRRRNKWQMRGRCDPDGIRRTPGASARGFPKAKGEMDDCHATRVTERN